MTGGVGRLDAKGKLEATEHHNELALNEKGFAVFVIWLPKERMRDQIVVRLFDGDNRVVSESKPTKVDFRKGQTSTSAWALPMVPSPGPYRADVILDGTPIWRGFVGITP
jgi:hypothetical protein